MLIVKYSHRAGVSAIAHFPALVIIPASICWMPLNRL